MARSSDPKKVAVWRGRFRRFLDSGLSAARFCGAEEVSVSSFYYWQGKLGPKARRRTARVTSACTGPVGRCRTTDEGDAGTTGRGLFTPVTITPSGCGVVVRLPNGTRIEMDPNHVHAIRAVVAEVVRGTCGRTTEQDVPSDNHISGKRGGARSC